MSQIHHINFCPGCCTRTFDSEHKDVRLDSPCCNPQCQGIWGTGCYHCHHPAFWPNVLYVVTANLHSKKGSRVIQSYIRAAEAGGGMDQAVRTFTSRLAKVLLVQHGSKWRITVCQNVPGSPGDFGSIRATYEHYAKGATVYHDRSPAFAPGAEEEVTKEPKPEPEPKVVPERKPKLETRMSREAALDALRVYVSQQVEVEALSIIDLVIATLRTSPGEQSNPHTGIRVGNQTRILVGSCPADYRYNDVLEHAKALNLGTLEPPQWLERFEKLIEQIRDEFDLREHVATPMPGNTYTGGD